MSQNKLKPMDVYFSVKNFKCDPVEITKTLKVKPSKAWKAGDLANERVKYKNSSWSYSSVIKSEFLEDHLRSLLKKFSSLSKLNKLVSKKNRTIQVVVNVKAGDTSPVLSISADTMAKLSKANLSVDVDLYAW